MKVILKFLSALVAVVLFSYPVTSTATTWHITPDGSGDVPTIQAGLDLALTGDIVELADGTFTGDGNRDLDYLGKAITVRSQSGNPENCIIDCESGPDSHRGFIFQSGEGHDSVLEGVTVSNGFNSYTGSGIYCNFSSPIIRNVIFKDNWGSFFGGGAGLACNGSNLEVVDCVFWENRSEGYPFAGRGGGAYCHDSTPTFTDCIFYGNSADSNFDSGGVGAGLVLELSEATITNCSFMNNYIGLSHMGIARGAGIFANSSTAVIEFCTFSGNTSNAGAGAAVATFGECNLVLNNCTMFGNEADVGTVHLQGGEVEINNTIIANNEIPEWPMYNEPGAVVVWEGLVTLNCCDIYDNESGDWEGAIADQFGINGNISDDPLFCDADNSDFTIRSDSPCAPEFSHGCGLIGVLGVGCEPPSAIGDRQPPMAFHLEQAYPNPFNPRTTIAFSLPHQEYVQISIFDLTGRQVRTLATRTFPAGDHSLEWNGRDDAGRTLASGSYLIRLKSETKSRIQKVTLIK